MNMLMITGILLNMLISYGSGDEQELASKILNYEEDAIIEEVPGDSTHFQVDVTAYSPTVSETDSTPLITASNKMVKEGYIAVSRDLEAYLEFGDKVFIEDIGIFEVQDRMNRRWSKRVDIFFYNTKRAIQFGKVKKKMWILDSKKHPKKIAMK